MSIGLLHGVMLGVLIGRGLPLLYIPPTKFKYTVMGPGKHEKTESVSRAKELYPSIGMVDHNAAEALLLAHTARRYHETLEDSSETDNEFRTFYSGDATRPDSPGIIWRKGEFYIHPNNSWLEHLSDLKRMRLTSSRPRRR